MTMVFFFRLFLFVPFLLLTIVPERTAAQSIPQCAIDTHQQLFIPEGYSCFLQGEYNLTNTTIGGTLFVGSESSSASQLSLSIEGVLNITGNGVIQGTGRGYAQNTAPQGCQAATTKSYSGTQPGYGGSHAGTC